MIPTPRDEARRLARAAIPGDFKPEALHAYTDEKGEALYWRIRARLADGSKWIRPMRKSGDGCELGEPKFPNGKPLYLLHELAAEPSAPAWYVEGENCADALAKLGLLATTAGGASSDEHADYAPLAGRAVTIWPDNDGPGIEHAQRVAARLHTLRCSVELVDAGALGLEEGGDCVNWLQAHPEATAAHLSKLPRMRARSSSVTSPAALCPIIALGIDELLTREFPPMEAMLSPWLRKQYLAMVYSRRGVGKTHFGLGVAYAVAGGGKFLKWHANKARKVLYIDGEMPGAAIRERLAAIVKSSAADKEPPEGYFRIITPDVQARSLPDLGTPEGQAEIGALLGDAELIVLDSLSTLMRSGTENEGESWLPMASWALARRREGRAVLFIHHAGKNDSQRGSSRREDLLDVVIKLKHPGDYTPDRGAQFSVIFEKARGLYGDDVREIEAELTQGDGGAQLWTCREAEGATQDRVVERLKLGLSDAEIAADLGKDRTTVYRARKKAEEAGLIESRHGKRSA